MALAIAASVLMVMVFQIVFYSVTESGRLAVSGRLEHMTVVYPGDGGIVGQSVLNKIQKSSDMERIVPMLVGTTDYYHLFGNLNIPVYLISNQNINYVIDQLDLELKEGRLPVEGKSEILLDERTSKNKGKQLGDFIGREVDSNERLAGKYQIVGTLKGDCLIGLSVTNDLASIEKTGFLLFAKAGRLGSLNKVISGTSLVEARIQTEEYGEGVFEEDNKMMSMVSSIITAVIIFIMSFAAGNSSYAQYFSRRYEFGTLQSIGYSRAKILLRAAREILFMNVAGLIFGVILTLSAALMLKALVFDPKGYPFTFITIDGLLKAFIIPICTMIFSLIPAWWTLSRVNQVVIIEKYE